MAERGGRRRAARSGPPRPLRADRRIPRHALPPPSAATTSAVGTTRTSSSFIRTAPRRPRDPLRCHRPTSVRERRRAAARHSAGSTDSAPTSSSHPSRTAIRSRRRAADRGRVGRDDPGAHRRVAPGEPASCSSNRRRRGRRGRGQSARAVIASTSAAETTSGRWLIAATAESWSRHSTSGPAAHRRPPRGRQPARPRRSRRAPRER